MALTLSNIVNDEISGILTCTGTNDGTGAASSIFAGFTPRLVRVLNVTDTISHEWINGMTAGHAYKITPAPAVSIVTTNGVTPLEGIEAAPAATATGSPSSGGKGVQLGTDVLIASKSYRIVLTR